MKKLIAFCMLLSGRQGFSASTSFPMTDQELTDIITTYSLQPYKKQLKALKIQRKLSNIEALLDLLVENKHISLNNKKILDYYNNKFEPKAHSSSIMDYIVNTAIKAASYVYSTNEKPQKTLFYRFVEIGLWKAIYLINERCPDALSPTLENEITPFFQSLEEKDFIESAQEDLPELQNKTQADGQTEENQAEEDQTEKEKHGHPIQAKIQGDGNLFGEKILDGLISREQNKKYQIEHSVMSQITSLILKTCIKDQKTPIIYLFFQIDPNKSKKLLQTISSDAFSHTFSAIGKQIHQKPFLKDENDQASFIQFILDTLTEREESDKKLEDKDLAGALTFFIPSFYNIDPVKTKALLSKVKDKKLFTSMLIGTLQQCSFQELTEVSTLTKKQNQKAFGEFILDILTENQSK
ncbi:MAG: hypothetical protein AAF335_02580, partial [Bacteroidota bacterium]